MKTVALLLFSFAHYAGTIHIRVLNEAHVPTATLAEAERIAGRILRAAGIDPVWLDCDAPGRPCRNEPNSTDFWLHLLPHRPPGLENDTAGFALLVPGCSQACGYAAVSYPAVKAVAGQFQADPVHLLGAAITHEIGHLLLGSHSHSHGGVMSARLGREQIDEAGRGSLLFTESQAQQLRREVVERSVQ